MAECAGTHRYSSRCSLLPLIVSLVCSLVCLSGCSEDRRPEPVASAVGTQRTDEPRRIELYTSPKIPSADLPIPRNIVPPETLSDPQSIYKEQYAFTSDWFTGSLPVWRKVLAEYRGKPNLRYLEIGVYEGRSLFWMLENVLTDPTCRATGIDFFFNSGAKTRFYENLELSGQPQKVSMLEGLSDEILAQLLGNKDQYDLIYVDGSHAAEDVLFDLIMSWRLLKVGGLLLLDDYGMTPDRSAENRPMVAIDAFITAHRNSIEIVHHAYQVVIRKR